MKNYLITIILLCSVLSGFGQTEKGKFLMGASSNLNFSFLNSQTKVEDYESDKIKNSAFEINADGGYFVANNLALGLGVIYSQSSEKEEDDKVVSSTFAAGPFVRYYFGRDKIQPFLQSSLAFGKSVEKYDTNYIDDKYNSSLIGYDFGGGLSITILKNMAIELGVSYSIVNSSYKDHYNQKARILVKGISTDIGFVFLL